MQLIFVSGLSTAEAVTELSGRGIGMDVVQQRDRRRRRPHRHRQHARPGHHLHHLPAAHAGGDAGGAGARRRQRARGLLGDGRAGAAPEGRRAWPRTTRRRPSSSRTAQLPAARPGAAARARACPTVAGLQLGAAAAQRHPAHRAARGRAARQPGNRGEEHRAAARARARRVGRDGARRRQHRADRQPGAAGAARAPGGGAHRRSRRPRRGAAPAAPVVMVVDDSLTVRKITSRLLEREGYQVLTAKDGAGRARADEGRAARRDAGGHRDAAHGRLRPDAQRARRPAHARRARSS